MTLSHLRWTRKQHKMTNCSKQQTCKSKEEYWVLIHHYKVLKYVWWLSIDRPHILVSTQHILNLSGKKPGGSTDRKAKNLLETSLIKGSILFSQFLCFIPCFCASDTLFLVWDNHHEFTNGHVSVYKVE